MLLDYIAFQIGYIEMFFYIVQCCFCVGKAVQTLALGSDICVPVVKEEVVKQTCPCSRTFIQREKFADPVIIV